MRLSSPPDFGRSSVTNKPREDAVKMSKTTFVIGFLTGGGADSFAADPAVKP